MAEGAQCHCTFIAAIFAIIGHLSSEFGSVNYSMRRLRISNKNILVHCAETAVMSPSGWYMCRRHAILWSLVFYQDLSISKDMILPAILFLAWRGAPRCIVHLSVDNNMSPLPPLVSDMDHNLTRNCRVLAQGPMRLARARPSGTN